jgi:protein-S-isoprenylcysteine O-methyltransferase Ste14
MAMRKLTAALGSAVFFAVAPLMVAYIAPWWIAGWKMAAPFFNEPLFQAAGFLLVLAGSVPLIESFARFALVGLGTPAPIAPPKRLVVTGFYRYVRNPMYVGVLAVILGNGLILGNATVFGYAVVVAIAFNLFVLGYEEPALSRQFGADYLEFCRHVPRWLPRLTPWHAATKE